MKSKIKLNLLVFELTDACNQQCKFCYNHWKGLDEVPVLPKSEYSKAKKVLKKVFSQADVNSISFSGGEPLLFPHIHDLILTARFNKTQVSVLTNGTLLKEFDFETFEQLGVHRIQIPILSSNHETHDALTQLSGSWNKCTSSARRILESTPDKLNAVLVITKRNLPDLKETLEFYASMGIQTVLVNRYNVGGLGRKYNDELELIHEELQNAFLLINDFAKSSSIRFHSGVCTPICVLDPADYPLITFSFCNTDVSVRPITINHQGDVRFCNHSPRVLGNVFERSLNEILYSTENDDYYNSIPSFCVSCNFLQLCKGGCRAASEQVYNTFSKVDPLLSVLK